jgi:hypothetical protein
VKNKRSKRRLLTIAKLINIKLLPSKGLPAFLSKGMNNNVSLSRPREWATHDAKKQLITKTEAV